MANDKSTFGSDQLQADDYFIRNCPTPNFNFGDSESLNSELLGSFDGNFDSFPDEELNNYMSMGQSNSPTAMAAQFVSSSNTPQSTFYENAAQPSASFINANSPFDYIQNDTNSFMPIRAGSSREEDNKTPLFTDMSDTMSTKNGRKPAKCMTRNAVLARQNREKKKNEMHTLLTRMNEVEEENASLRKKCSEYKKGYDNVLERNTYLEAIIQNLPQIVNMVDHMQSLPGNNNKLPNFSKKT